MKKLIAGNWKMNGTRESAVSLAENVREMIRKDPGLLMLTEFLVCPPALHLEAVRAEIGPDVSIGAQDCSPYENGAHTGDLSAEMLKEYEAKYVILGHSERRQGYKEPSELIREKAKQAHAQGLTAIICVGETEEEREAGNHQSVVRAQLKESLPEGFNGHNTVIAYEPVWAIGTGKTATTDDIAEMHDFIRKKLENNSSIRILYGGSVKPDNAQEILHTSDVDGALIGGASLKAKDYIDIAKHCKKGLETGSTGKSWKRSFS